MEGIMEEILKTVAPYIATVVGLLLSWGVYELNQYIRSKTRKEAAIAAIGTLGTITATTVRGLAQTATGSLADGKFTKAEGVALKAEAVASIKEQVTPALKKQLDIVVKDLDTFVSSQTEASVMDLKIEKATAGLPEHNEPKKAEKKLPGK